MIFGNIKSYIRTQLLIALSLYIGNVNFGFGLAWTSPMIPKLQNMTETPLSYVISDDEASWIVTLILLGTLGISASGFIVNLIGRRTCVIIGAGIIFICYVLMGFAYNITMIYIGRLILGFSMSFATVNSLVYIGEMSSTHVRGMMLTLTGVSESFGALLMYCVGPFMTYLGVNLVGMGLAAIYMFACFFIPESPMYYIIKGNEEAARTALKNLGRVSDIENELKIMIANVQQRESGRNLLRQMFYDKSNRKALFVVTLLYFFQMNGGIVMMIFFATTIFTDAGSSIPPYLATIIIGLTLFASSIISPLTVERFGRRALLMISTGGCCVCMTLIGVYFYLKMSNPESIEFLRWLPLVSMVVAFVTYAAGLAIIPNTITGEMFESNVRGIGSSISFMVGSLSMFISTKVFSYLMVRYGNHYGFWLFAVINAFGLIFAKFVVPETTGKTLTEINTMMAG